jgi:AhpD family alkylhydroperoxidase
MKAALTPRNLGIDALENRFGVSMDYARHILSVAPGVLDRLALLIPVIRYRRVLPAAVTHFVQMGAALAEDCGPCVQIGVNEALRAGVDPAHLRLALEGREDDLPEELRDALCFGRAVAERRADLTDLRDRLRARWGEAGVIEASLAVATAQLYPVLKRGMGFARSVGEYGVTVDPARGAGAAAVA